MSIQRLIDKLEALYPEHKVFALDGVDSKLREALAECYKTYGYSTMEELLTEYGFEIISGEAVRELRSFVMYTPGNEPEVVAGKVESILRRLEEYYPQRRIVGGMQKEHKSLASDITGMYQWLGYRSMGDFLQAYGFEYVVGVGRGETDFDAVVDYLMEKYSTAPKPKNMGLLMYDNPDLRASLKTMQNRAPELFGMSLKKYFEDLGLFEERAGAAAASGGSPAGKAPVGGKMQEAAQNALRQLYASGAQGEYGTSDDLEEAFSLLTMKQNKSGQIYIQKALSCPEEIRIPYGVNLIADGAFADCAILRKVTLPGTVSEIGKEAFLNCAALESLDLPANLAEIGKRAFVGCGMLKELDLSRCMARIANDAFDDGAVKYMPGEGGEPTDFVYTLDKQHQITITGYQGAGGCVEIPEQINGLLVVGIARETFAGVVSLEEITMPDSITDMGAQVFAGCAKLRRARLSNGIRRLYANAFNGCVALEEVNIPDSIFELKANTFKDSMVRRLHIGKSLPTLNVHALFSGSYDTLGSYIDRGVVEELTVSPESEYLRAEGTLLLSADGKTLHAALGRNGFYRVPDGVETIAAGAFQGLRGLTDIQLPDSLTAIGDQAFMNTSLRAVRFGKQVCSIGERAFAYCEKLSSVLFSEGVETIGAAAFQGCPLVTLSLPASLRELGEYAFSFMERYRWGDTLKTLEISPGNPWFRSEQGGFYRLEDGKKILLSVLAKEYASFEVSEGTTHIGNGVFQYQYYLKQVFFPTSLVEIGKDAFHGCSELVIAELPEGLRVIGERAFLGTSVGTFRLPTTLETIGHGALTAESIVLCGENPRFLLDDNMLYERCQDGTLTALAFFGEAERYTLQKNTSVIAANAFTGADLLELLIPQTVVTIEENAFENCNRVVRLYMEQRAEARWAVVYLPEPEARFLFLDDTSRRQMVDCIRINGEGELFDFVKYDSLFDGISQMRDRVLIAVDRLKSAVDLLPEYRNQYETFLRNNPKDVLTWVVEYDDNDGCRLICDLGIVNAGNIEEAIRMASERQNAGMTSFFMEYKKKINPGFNPFAAFKLKL